MVDEGALAVDLDHRQPLAVAGLELRVAGDVDRLVGHSEAVELAAGALTEVAPVRRVDDDAVRDRARG